MKATTLLTAALVLALGGMASAQCMHMGEKTATTAENTYTPIPDQEPAEVAENPLLLIPTNEDEDKAEG